jgi:hypothetical protein
MLHLDAEVGQHVARSVDAVRELGPAEGPPVMAKGRTSTTAFDQVAIDEERGGVEES